MVSDLIFTGICCSSNNLLYLVLSSLLCWKEIILFLTKVGRLSQPFFTRLFRMKGGACSCRRGSAQPPPPSWFELLDQPLACLPVLPLFPISLQSAARILLLNYNPNDVIQQSINFLDSTVTIKLDKCIRGTFWILLNIIKQFLNVW